MIFFLQNPEKSGRRIRKPSNNKKGLRALDCVAEGRWFESHSGQWLENSLCSHSS